MNTVIVNGGKRLAGEVRIGGSKNAALPVLFGGIVTGEVCVFSALPRVSDVLRSLEILHAMGARIRFLENKDVSVDYSTVRPVLPPPQLTGAIRGSTYLLGSMLARFGSACLAGAGGCDFGTRPIDQHLRGFAALGATTQEGEILRLSAPNGLAGADITLAMPSVGATANLLLAAVTASGETVIRNAAAEPHVVALAEFLCAAGAKIEGIGTDTVRICGVSRLHGVAHRIIPDMIEAGTYLCMGMACEGPVTVTEVCPAHLTALLDAFGEMGGEVKAGCDWVRVACPHKYRNIGLETAPYPGFPTDLHPQLTALFSLGDRAEGIGVMRERIWQERFRYVRGLSKMGADITVTGDRAIVCPVPLHAAAVSAPDLRGGAAILLAMLATNAKSELLNARMLSRGYEHLERKLTALGACVRAY